MEKLVEVSRGPLVESEHWGSIAVVDAQGNLVAWAGEPECITFYRSAAKPLQALPVLTSGAAERYHLKDQEIAIICASHSGEDVHVSTVIGLLEKLQLTPEHLLCGVHPPFYKPSAVELWRYGRQPSTVHCNCSGKHAGMLALCKHFSWPLDNYQEISHPLQELLLNSIKQFHQLEDIPIGVDGCGVPVYGMRLKDMAAGYAKLAKSWVREPGSGPVKRIVSAMVSYPELVAGTGRLDTVLMEVIPDRLVAKCGAEGVQCMGLLDRGLGIAIKITDGSTRATEPVSVEVLRQLGVISEQELHLLAEKHCVSIRNHRQETVGEIRANFQLQHK